MHTASQIAERCGVSVVTVRNHGVDMGTRYGPVILYSDDEAAAIEQAIRTTRRGRPPGVKDSVKRTRTPKPRGKK